MRSGRTVADAIPVFCIKAANSLKIVTKEQIEKLTKRLYYLSLQEILLHLLQPSKVVQDPGSKKKKRERDAMILKEMNNLLQLKRTNLQKYCLILNVSPLLKTKRNFRMFETVWVLRHAHAHTGNIKNTIIKKQ